MMRIVQAILSCIVTVAFRLKVKGLDKIPKLDQFSCPNHQSYIDPLLIFAIMPGWLLDRLMFVAFGEFFRRAPLVDCATVKSHNYRDRANPWRIA
jgi:1-acyl-sn-glycerol-3-phosphate acyltransferase